MDRAQFKSITITAMASCLEWYDFSIFVYIMPGKKALHDIISGTMLIKIAGKPKS